MIQILGLLGMHFEAVVVEVKTFLLLFRLALAIPQWFKYVYGTPEKVIAAWPRLKLYNFNISIL